jgi:hypothetical protein
MMTPRLIDSSGIFCSRLYSSSGMLAPREILRRLDLKPVENQVVQDRYSVSSRWNEIVGGQTFDGAVHFRAQIRRVVDASEGGAKLALSGENAVQQRQ